MINTREKAKLTQRKLGSTKGFKGKRHTISDTEVPGFRVVIGEETKTFILEKRITGVTNSPQKFTIGQFPAMTVDAARDKARRWTLLCRDGQDPTRVIINKTGSDGLIYSLKPRNIKTITLSKALELHLEYKKIATVTAEGYRSTVNCQFSHWKNTSLDDLKVEDLIKQAHQIALQVSNSRAVDCLKLIRAIWNTAKDYADSQGISCPGNPLKLISILKMFKLDRKKIVIPFSHVGRFIAHAEDMKDSRDITKGARLMMRLYLVSLFLGMRYGEARHLKWEYLDLESGYFKLPGHVVKNKKTHIKPIGPYTVSIFRELYQMRQGNNPYVFPTPSTLTKDKGKPIGKCRQFQALMLTALPENAEFTPHALRRTFISLADEINTPRKVLKNLVNHISGDVTDGYCVKEFNPQKEGPYLQRIEEALLICRDKYRNGEPLPTLAIDLFPKEGKPNDGPCMDTLKRLLAEKTEKLQQAEQEILRLRTALEKQAA